MSEGPARKLNPRGETRLEVKIPTATMLKVLWTANMAKGHWQVETPNEIPADRRVKVALIVPDGEIILTGVVRSCTMNKSSKGYFVAVLLDEPTYVARAMIEKVIGTVREVKRKVEKEADLFDDSDIEIK